jgi:hypothetical protein
MSASQVVVSRLWRDLSVLLHDGGVQDAVGSPAAPRYQSYLQGLLDKVRESGSNGTDVIVTSKGTSE